MSFLNQVLEFCKVIASSVGGTNTTTLYDVAGIGGFDDESDAAGEQAHEQECFTGLGLVGRPLPPDGALFCEAACARTEDGLVPLSFRDLRLHRALNASGAAVTPAAGQLMFVGYGGAFLSHALTAENTGSKKGNVSTWYCPYSFSGDGTPSKAMAIALDPSEPKPNLTIVHGSGAIITLTDDGITLAIDGSTFMTLRPGEFSVTAAKIMLKGNCYLGAQAEAGLPLLPGVASPPGPSVFVSPV